MMPTNSRHVICSHRHPSLQMVLATIACGTALGLLLQKLQVFEASQMQQQLLFEDATLMKMFLSAVISGMFACSILSMLPHTYVILRSTMNWYPLNFENRGYTSCALGGALLGTGMALTGACPTSLFVQLGSGVPNAVWVLAGGYCATISFDICRPFIGKCIFRRKFLVLFYLHRGILTPYFNIALPLAAVLAISTFSLELAKKSNPVVIQELQPIPIPWSPYYVGILITLLHLSMMGLFGRFITNSDGFTSINNVFLYLMKNQKFPANTFTLLFYLSVTVGAYLSTIFSSHPILWETPPPSWYQSFFGGMVVFYGSKLAAGCSIGHGVSGTMALSKLSLFVIPFFWSGGFVMSSFLKVMN